MRTRLQPPLSATTEHMLSLADLQSGFARAMTTGDRACVTAPLVGGANPSQRLDVHLRHYEASLTNALRDKFAACAWLIGAAPMNAAALAYVRASPPRQPCIAEYGEDFPQFLASFGAAPTLPYLESFATLEWIVGQLSIAIDYRPIAWHQFAAIGEERLIDSTVTFQPGLRYLRSAWNVDELMARYLGGTEPERFVLHELAACIEIRGARGTVHLARLDGATFVFRTELAAGRSIGDAAGRALEYDPAFDPGAALQLLVRTGLAIKLLPDTQEGAA